MALASPFLTPSVRVHWPMHGLKQSQYCESDQSYLGGLSTYPHAFAKTVPPASVNVDRVSSLSNVARICSLPGVMKKSALGLSPAAEACFTSSSDRVISWYELLVQLPIRPAPKVLGQSFSSINDLNLDSGVERSGVNGPLMWGSSSDRLISITLSYTASESGRRRFCCMGRLEISKACWAIGPRCVASRYGTWAGEKGKSDVVAPTSAPMLQIVAMPVQLSVCTPGPKYSMMYPVPPCVTS
jgi:hypothetical protein